MQQDTSVPVWRDAKSGVHHSLMHSMLSIINNNNEDGDDSEHAVKFASSLIKKNDLPILVRAVCYMVLASELDDNSNAVKYAADAVTLLKDVREELPENEFVETLCMHAAALPKDILSEAEDEGLDEEAADDWETPSVSSYGSTDGPEKDEPLGNGEGDVPRTSNIGAVVSTRMATRPVAVRAVRAVGLTTPGRDPSQFAQLVDARRR